MLGVLIILILGRVLSTASHLCSQTAPWPVSREWLALSSLTMVITASLLLGVPSAPTGEQLGPGASRGATDVG